MPAQHPADILRALLNASPAGIVGVDPAGNIQLWNRAAQELFGWTEEEVIGRPWPWAIDPSSTEGAIEVPLTRKDGTEIDTELRMVPWQADGAIKGVLSIVEDLTHRRTAERELVRIQRHEKAERRFRELLEAAPDAIIEVDREGRIVLLNRVTEKMFGYLREELLGRSVDFLLPDDLRATHHQHRANYWNNPMTRTMGSGLALQGQRKDRTRFPVEISLSPVKSEDGFRVTAIIRDISERKEAERRLQTVQETYTREVSIKNQELELRNREIERANRLKSEFLASMSHELRTPLHTIIGFSELLREEVQGSLNEKQQRFIGHIHKDSLHLLDLINDILDLSKIEAGRLELRLESFHAGSAIEEVVSTIRPQASAKSHRLETRVDIPVAINADRVRFKQILYNLLSNATKFTPENGHIQVHGSVREGMVEISVSDTGFGIPPQEHAFIFDKFYQVGETTKGVREGTGLGLAITKRLIEQHGGRIWLESEPGKGSCFTFSIPL